MWNAPSSWRWSRHSSPVFVSASSQGDSQESQYARDPLASAASSFHFRSRKNLLVAALLLVGVALRIWILASPRLSALDQDESVSALMARHLIRGEFTPFFWGQSYGGTLEIAVLATSFWIFGSHGLVAKLVATVLHALGVWLTWCVGKRLFDRRIALLGAALAWAWPTYAVWRSLRSHTFYAASLVLVMGGLLLIIKIAEAPGSLTAFGLGAVVGLGWWTHPQTLFVLIPAAIWLLARDHRSLRFGHYAAVGGLLGAFPWIWVNATQGWPSLREALLVDSPRQYLEALGGQLEQAFPSALGLRVPGSSNWVVGAPVVGWLCYGLLLLGLFHIWRRRSEGQGLIWASVVGFLLILPLSQHSLYKAEPRYLYVLMPLLALLMAQLAASVKLGTILPTMLVALSALGLVAMNNFPKDTIVPADFQPLIDELESQHIDRVFAYHTIAYRLSFESGEEIVATAMDHVRYQPFDRLVREDQNPSFVFAPFPDVASDVMAELRLLDIEYSSTSAGDFVIVTPNSHVVPENLRSWRVSG